MGQAHSSEEQAAPARLHWLSGLAPAGACVMARIRHPRGLPRGAARMLARWVRRGSQHYPTHTRVQEALTRHGSTLSCTVALDYTEFCVNTADWRWGLAFLLDVLAQPVLDDDVYEDLQLESDEEWRAPTAAMWVARAWGWVAPEAAASAAHLRGVWEHLYTFRYIQLLVGGAIPARVPPDFSAILRAATAPHPAVGACQPWEPPAAPAAAPLPAPGTHAGVAPDTSGAGATATLTLLFPVPARLSLEMRQCLALVLEEIFGAACRHCPSWAQGVRCAWHAMGGTALVLALECAVDPRAAADAPAFARQALQVARARFPRAADTARARDSMRKRRRVQCTRLDGAVRQAAEARAGEVETEAGRTPEQLHAALAHVLREHVLLPGPRATCLCPAAGARRRKNAAVGQRHAAADASSPHNQPEEEEPPRAPRRQGVGGADALCPPPPHAPQAPSSPAIRV